MSRTVSRCIWRQSSLIAIPESSPLCRLPIRCLRPFSNTSRKSAEEDDISSLASMIPDIGLPKPKTSQRPLQSPSLHPKAQSNLSMNSLLETFGNNQDQRDKKAMSAYNPHLVSDGVIGESLYPQKQDPHHFHIYATRHNTHITLTDPKRNPIISLSAGNIGFKHSGRKHYDSAFQLASYVMGRMQERAINKDIKALEVILRGFGQGREAVTKALLGSEGRFLRGKVIRVADATRLKFGGTRSKKPRRLG